MKSGHRAKKIIQGRENHVCQSLRRARRVQGTKGRPGWLCRGVYTEERARWQWGPGTTGLCRLGKEIHTEGTKTVPQHSSTHSCPDVTTKITLWLKIRARRALEDDLTHTWPLGSNHHFKAGTPRLSKFNRFSWDFQSALRLDLPNSMPSFSTLYRQCKAVPWEFTGC